MSTLDGQDGAADAPPLVMTLLLLLSLLLSPSAIPEEDIAGGVLSSADTDLDTVPADNEDVVDVDDNGAMVATVIAMPDTMGGDKATEAIILALLPLTRQH